MTRVPPLTDEQQQSVIGEFPGRLYQHHASLATNHSSFDDCPPTEVSL